MTSRCPTKAVAGEHGHPIEPGRRQRQIECGGDILRLHGRQSFQATMKREKSSSTVER